MRFRRSMRGWNVTDILLLLFIVFLFSVLISRQVKRNTSSHPTERNDQEVNPKPAELEEVKIKRSTVESRKKNTDFSKEPGDSKDGDDSGFLTRDKIHAIPDTRPPGCPTAYTRALEHRVSIIMHFYDYQFYDVKQTYRSLRHNTPDEIIKEILLVDAGSTIQYIRNDAEHFARTTRKVRLLKTDIRESPTRARHYAADQAAGSVLVFVDSNAICNRGWLEPLVDAIDQNAKTISVPHYDFVEDPALNIYKEITAKSVHIFSWDMTLYPVILDQDEAGTTHETLPGTTPYETPVIRSSVFAIQSAYYKTLGELDEEFSQPGGEMLEFSMRAWMCGAKVWVIPCSRVGLLDLHDSQQIPSKHNIARLTNLWFDKPHTELINHYRQAAVTLGTEQINGILVRKGTLQHLKCKNTEWYLNKFQHLIARPQDVSSVVYGKSRFGYLKSESGRCMAVGSDSVIELVSCPFHVYKKDMLFEFNANTGQLTVRGKCLTVENTYDVMARTCKLGNRNQLWTFTPPGEIRLGAHSKDCATHVSGPSDAKTKYRRQVIMLQRCSDDSRTFNRFKFLLK